MKNTLGKLSHHFKAAAVFVLSFVVVIFIANIAAWAALEVRDLLKAHGGDMIPDNPWVLREKAYPGWKRSDIFDLHMETWERRGFEYAPISQFKEAPFSGQFVNVTTHGYRKGRIDNPWPPAPDRYNVFVFGGSTTFGYGVPDWQTVPSFIQDSLQKRGRKIAVYNFGTSYFFSTHELLSFQRLIMAGYKPDLAVFIDGMNEFYYRNTDLIWTDRLKKSAKGSSYSVSGSIVHLLQAMPAYELFTFMIRRLQASKANLGQQARQNVERIIASGRREISQAVLDRYIRNSGLIRALASARGVATLFVWQPVPMYNYDLDHHLFAYREMGDHVAAGAGYRAARERYDNGEFGEDFIWCADIQVGAKRPLYVDAVHYNADLSGMLARCIVESAIVFGG